MAAAQSANIDQGMASLRHLAILWGAYYRGLLEAGFSRRQAFDLVCHRDEMMLARVLWPEAGHDVH